jgi:hypothetical protein
MRVLLVLLVLGCTPVLATNEIHRWFTNELVLRPYPGARLIESGCTNGSWAYAHGPVNAVANKNTAGGIGFADPSTHVSKFRIEALPNARMPTGQITRVAFRIILAKLPVSGQWDIFLLRAGVYAEHACSLTNADTCLWVFPEGSNAMPGSDVSLEVWARGKYADYASRWCVTRFALMIEVTD